MGATCRSCGAGVEWARLMADDGTSKAHPVDAQPDQGGNLACRRDGNDLIARPISRQHPLEAGELRGMSHFATCPSADQHRSKR